MMSAAEEPRATAEYVDDRALQRADSDQLGHAALADEVSRLVRQGDTPLHIAIYGAWGSGKSSLATLLKSRLETDHKRVRFVLFDAWKFAEAPLQRHFITQTATQLGFDKDQYERELYEKTTKSRLRVPPREGLWLLAHLLMAAGAVLMIPMVVAAAIAWFSDREFAARLRDVLSSAVAPSIISATFVAALLAIAGRVFTTDVEETEVSSDERFEALFRRLVRRATRRRKQRLVFFVDELDRCAPGEVVSVLETLRTFLDVPNCVYVVAADQQVLERALAKAASHAVPQDPERPYYSSGSEYLDKIFQHQIQIPPLYPQRLTQFATDLVAGKQGVWTQAEDLATLVGVIVPSHVRSPRRAKVLLNGFVSYFRIAANRHRDAPDVTPDPSGRLLELAKLSTLRLEFPLFYRAVTSSPQLIRLLTQFLVDGSTWADETKRQATAYELVDKVEEFASAARDVAVTLGETETDEETEDSEIQSRRGDELLRYLERTSSIEGPRRDLVFLESVAAPYGLESELADLIEEDAIDRRIPNLLARMQDLSQSEREAALLTLASLHRNVRGVEAENVLLSILAVAESGLIDLTEAPPELLAPISAATERGGLPLDAVAGALALAAASKINAGFSVANEILDDPRLTEAENIGTTVRLISQMVPHFDRLAPKLREMILDAPAGFTKAIMDQSILSSTNWAELMSDEFLEALAAAWGREEAKDEELLDFRALVQLVAEGADAS